MTPTGRAAAFVSLAPLALIALAGCDKLGGKKAEGGGSASPAPSDLAAKLFTDDFKGVCSGASVSRATAYDPAAPAHKAIYYSPYKDNLTDSSSSLPKDWTVQWSADSDALRAIDLVACAKRTATKEVKLCDGYKDGGKPTENKVRWHTATYELSLREATTGKLLDQTTLEATDSECPMFQSFDSPTETVDSYASLSDTAVNDFLRKYMAK